MAMATLGSRVFEAADVDNALFCAMERWLESLPKNLGGLQITVAVKYAKEQRQHKNASLMQMQEAVGNAAVEMRGDVTFAKWGYRFLFAVNSFWWNNHELHITANEALFLFKWLVQGDKDYYQVKWYCLRNLRKRYGKDFLAEVNKGDNT